MPKLGVMQLVHDRPHVLPYIWRQLPHLGCPVHLSICLSRPNTDVMTEVERVALYGLGKRTDVDVIVAPFSPLAERERWMELRQFQLEHLPKDCTHGVIWDDDHILEDVKEPVEAITDGADLTYITKVFFWNSPLTYNTLFPRHNSVFTFRMLPGDRFDMGRILHAPARVHDNPSKITQLQGRLLDYGYLREEDRARCWAEYKQAGKIDAATRPLVQPPKLAQWDGVNPFANAITSKPPWY